MLSLPRYINVHKKRISTLLAISLVAQLVYPVFFSQADAAALTEAAIRLDRMGASVAASTDDRILVVFKPTSTATEANVKISWPTTNAFTVSSTDSDHTTSTTGLPSTFQGETLTAVPTLGSPGAETTGEVTFTTGDLTAGTLYGFFITGGITNPATGDAGQHQVTITTQTSGPADIDTTTVTVDTTTTDADLVTVTGSVGATFNFALGGNSISLGSLTTGAIANGNVTVDIDSNAANGWAAWARSEGAAATFSSAMASHDISTTDSSNGTPDSLSAGTEGYVVDVAAAQGGGGSGVVSEGAEFAGNGTSSGGVLSTTYQQIAQSTGQANSDTLTLTALVAIDNLTPAATDYTDTWEVVGAGNF